MLKKLSSLLLLLFICNYSVIAQIATYNGDEADAISNARSITPKSEKDVASVDLFTGTAGVSVPLYSYETDGMNLGISLAYNASGIKVDDMASLYGIGWVLNGIPNIQRVTNGIEDEIWIGVGSKSAKGAWVSGADPELNFDMFVADLGGRQIKFSIGFLNDVAQYSPHADSPANVLVSRKIATSPRSEILIEPLYNGSVMKNKITWIGPTYDARLITFRLTDEKGNTFWFDKVESQFKKYEWDDSTSIGYDVGTRWYVSKIRTYAGAYIYYQYNDVYAEYLQYHDERCIEQLPLVVNAGERYPGWYVMFTKNEDVLWDGIIKEISKIIYPNGATIDFVPSTTYRRDLSAQRILDKITISSGYDAVVKNSIEFKLGQEYFYAQGSTPTRSLTNTTDGTALDYRLKLNYISRKVNNNAPKDYYTFTYETVRLPSRLSPSQDYYGYFNNKTPNTIASGQYQCMGATPTNPKFSAPLHNFNIGTQLPAYSPATYNVTYGVDKTPDINYLKAGCLKTITNSMRGQLELFYEAHTSLSSPPNSNSYCDTKETGTNSFDGLRIQKIEYKDGFSSANNVIQKFTYSGGYRFYPKLYYWYPIAYSSSMVPGNGNTTEQFIFTKKWFSGPVNSLDLFNGFNHGYDNVIEQEEGYNGEIQKKIRYTFSNVINQETGISDLAVGASRLTEKKRFSSELSSPTFLRQHEMGLLLKREEYMVNGATDILVSKIENEYETSLYNSFNNYDPVTRTIIPNYTWLPQNRFTKFMARIVDDQPDGYTLPYNHTAYPLFSVHKRRIKKTISTAYSGSTPKQSSLEYEYDARDNVTKVKWKDSKGDDYYKTYVYRYSVNTQHLTNTHIYKDLPTTDLEVSKKSVSYYTPQLTPAGDRLVLLKQTNNATITNAGLFESKTEYITRDTNNNAIEIKHQDGLEYSVQLWDTFYNKIATVSNARIADIAYTSFEGLKSTGTYTDYNKGYWSFNHAQVKNATGIGPGHAMTGRYFYELTNGGSPIVKTIAFDKSYYLTFWAYRAPLITVSGTTVTLKEVQSSNDFNLYACIIPQGITSGTPPPNRTLTIFNNIAVPTYIDELRLHPTDAVMTTSTYEPLLGISSLNDGSNNIIYTEYDTEGQASILRDVDGNIIKKTDMVSKGSNW